MAPEKIYDNVWQVFESILDVYRQLLATESDFFDSKTPFLGPFLTINSGPLAAKMRHTAVIWHLKGLNVILISFKAFLRLQNAPGTQKDK